MPTDLKGLHEQVEAGKQLIQLLRELIQTHPLLAGFLLFVALLTLVVQLRATVVALSTEGKGHPRRFVVIAGILATLSASTIAYLSTRPTSRIQASSPADGADVIGESITLKWQFAPDSIAVPSSDVHPTYTVQYTIGGREAETRTSAQYHALQPPPGKIVWRVRARWLAGGSSHVSQWSAWRTNYFYHSALERVRLTGILRVGVSQDYFAPYIFHDDKIDDLTGIDIQSIRNISDLLAPRIGLQRIALHFESSSWLDGNSADLKRGVTDVAIGAASILPEREKQWRIRFTVPYWYEKMALVTRKDHAVPNLHDARLTAWRDTTYESLAKSLTTNYSTSYTIPEMIDKTSSGEVDGFIEAADIAYFNIRQNGDSHLCVRMLEASELPTSFLRTSKYPIPAGLYVNEQQAELLAVLNAVIGSPEALRRLHEIESQYRQPGVQ